MLLHGFVLCFVKKTSMKVELANRWHQEEGVVRVASGSLGRPVLPVEAEAEGRLG